MKRSRWRQVADLMIAEALKGLRPTLTRQEVRNALLLAFPWPRMGAAYRHWREAVHCTVERPSAFPIVEVLDLGDGELSRLATALTTAPGDMLLQHAIEDRLEEMGDRRLEKVRAIVLDAVQVGKRMFPNARSVVRGRHRRLVDLARNIDVPVQQIQDDIDGKYLLRAFGVGQAVREVRGFSLLAILLEGC